MHASINWTDWSVFNKLVAYFPGEQKLSAAWNPIW